MRRYRAGSVAGTDFHSKRTDCWHEILFALLPPCVVVAGTLEMIEPFLHSVQDCSWLRSQIFALDHLHKVRWWRPQELLVSDTLSEVLDHVVQATLVQVARRSSHFGISRGKLQCGTRPARRQRLDKELARCLLHGFYPEQTGRRYYTANCVA